VNDLMKKALSLGVGMTMVGKEKIESYVDELVRKGDVAPTESNELVSRLIAKGEEQKAEIKRMVQEQLNNLLADLKVANLDDIARLERRIEKLEGTATPPPPGPPIL
jgi:polyhydroxyalkanoate synthesis regulator phasin